MVRVRGQLVLADRIIDGEVAVSGSRIARVRPGRAPHDRYIAPGFIDLHRWGEPSTLARAEPRGGTTSFLTTLGPLPSARLIRRLATWSAQPPTNGARWLGIHLEGPWVNRSQAGALNPAAIRSPRLAEAQQLWRASRRRIRLVTVAPERVSRVFLQWWRRRSVVVSCGHTAATYEATRRAIAAGIRCATHLGNKMGAPHQRRPGALGALLEDPRVMAMLLVDRKHLHPTTVKLLYRLLGVERLVLATDATRALSLAEDAAMGLRRGQFRGKLAGTQLTMIEAVKNLTVFASAPLPEAVRMASASPARLLGQDHRLGRLAAGAAADLVVFDRRFRVLQTLVAGRIVYQR